MLFNEVDGIKIYDPRVDERVISDNPALILGYMVEKGGAIVGEGFWPKIAVWADYLDAAVNAPLTREEIEKRFDRIGGANDESKESVP